ncbi:hypothetical protein [Azospirillum sp. sgz302134]
MRANSVPVRQASGPERGRDVHAGETPDHRRVRPDLRPDLRIVPMASAPAPEPERLARVIHMASLGCYVAVHHGRLVEVNGRMTWPSAESLARDARTAGIVASPMAIDTTRA